MERPHEFSYFPRLPPELRVQISRNWLDGQHRPAIFAFKPGLWQLGELVVRDDDPFPDEETYDYQFRHEQLDPIQVDLALVWVNHEARAIALAWARDRGFKIHLCEPDQHHVLLRSYEPTLDILYVARHHWKDFAGGFSAGHRVEEMIGKSLLSHPVISHLAVPKGVLEREASIVQGILQHYSSVLILYIVEGEGPDFGDAPCQRWWELSTPTATRVLQWDEEKNALDVIKEGSGMDDKCFQRLEEEARVELREEYPSFDMDDLEIALAAVIERVRFV